MAPRPPPLPSSLLCFRLLACYLCLTGIRCHASLCSVLCPENCEKCQGNAQVCTVSSHGALTMQRGTPCMQVVPELATQQPHPAHASNHTCGCSLPLSCRPCVQRCLEGYGKGTGKKNPCVLCDPVTQIVDPKSKR